MSFLQTVGEYLKIFINFLWRILTFLPDLIGLPDWTIFIVAGVVITAIIGIKKFK